MSSQLTHVERLQGAGFNPETTCRYTGARLWPFPSGADTIAYYREYDGCLMRCRYMTPEEKAWIAAKPDLQVQQAAAFSAWITTTRTNYENGKSKNT